MNQTKSLQNAVRRTISRSSVVAPLLASMMLLAPPVNAQEEGFSLNRFTPTQAGDRFFWTQDAHPGNHLAPHAVVVLDYAHNPLVVSDVSGSSDEKLGAVVEHQAYAHVGAALGLFERLKVDISVPVALVQDGSDTDVGGVTLTSPDGAAFGDIRLGVKSLQWASAERGLEIALAGYVWLPTGQGDTGEFTGNGSVRGAPFVILSGKQERVIWSANLGFEIGEATQYVGTTAASNFQVHGALAYLAGSDEEWQLGAESNLFFNLEEVSRNTTNSELIFGAKWRAHPWFVAGLGAGPGLAGGLGTPDFRGLLSIALTPKYEPPAPTEMQATAECSPLPAPDADGDGVADEDDACPDAAGPASSNPERNGCADGDADGVLDKVDACPRTAGVEQEAPEKNGCPLPQDGDGDGIVDEQDACPSVAGVANTDPAKNGCPDRDGDGVLDSEDKCPDKHGPARPEDPEKHGCPAVEVNEKAIVILQKILFRTGKAEIDPASSPLLNEIASVLIRFPEIELVEVQGHTDNRGGRALNTRLAQERADAVVSALIQRGITASRLQSKGYGPDRPIAPNSTEAGRETNRRVAFEILKRVKKSGESPSGEEK